MSSNLLYLAALRHCLDLAEHEKGCISINKFITNSRGPGRDKLLRLIAEHSVYLSQDPSGNYVLQHVIGLHDPVSTEKICCLLRGNYVLLSSQQGGSHVVEKCLNSPWMDYVILDFLKWDRLWQLARDRYGNYVIQTALKVTKRANIPLHRRLLEKFQGHLDALRSGYGRNVINLIVRGVPLD
ncbi:pumilio homolog 18-like [Alnus glutinosa]|uniref:pumilio homolog 18-like n=1 Tax=Alnus glutinosa TaxID=3517 RepID=UPI002D7704B0|nr:pumilio homolog 18-like [Alnus glutinosa]